MIPRKDDRVNSFFKIIFDMPFGHALSGVRVQKVQRVKGFRGCGLPLRGNEYKAGVTGLLYRRTSHPAFTSIPSLTILTNAAPRMTVRRPEVRFIGLTSAHLMSGACLLYSTLRCTIFPALDQSFPSVLPPLFPVHLQP